MNDNEEYDAMVRIIKRAHEGDLEAENVYLHKILKHALADRTGAFFICGQGGDKDSHGLPQMIMVCPSYGADGFALYTKTKDYDAPSY